MIKHNLRICTECELVYCNGYVLCPMCGSQTVHYATAYSAEKDGM